MLKIVFLEKLFGEVELISIVENEPKNKIDINDVDIGKVISETTKKFYCYITILKSEREDVEENSSDIEPEDGELTDEDTRAQLMENDLLSKKLLRKISILEFFLSIMLDEELGVQTRCPFREIKGEWMVTKPGCKKCKGKRSCPTALEMPVERKKNPTSFKKFLASKNKYKLSMPIVDRSKN